MGATIQDEKKIDALQVALIYLKSNLSSILNIIGIGSKLRYTSQPTFNNPLDIIDKQYADNLLLGVTLSILTTDTYPLVFSTSSPLLTALFQGVPDIIVREQVTPDQFKWRTDLQPVYDDIANTVTLDIVPMDGDITFKP